jgi:predicted ATP-grasp superfamily ATP-dependent carboligase
LGIGRGNKVIRVDTARELQHVCEQAKHLGSPVIVQEMVFGPDTNHQDYTCFVSPQGTIVAEFMHRKYRIHPPHLGLGCYVESHYADDVMALGREIIRRLGYRGHLGLQFKRDQRDGRLYLLETLPRFPMTLALPIACGRDFPYYYYQTCLGQPYDVPNSFEQGRRWINVGHDFYSMRTYVKENTATWLQWIADLLGRPVFACFRWDDPLPGIVATVRMLRGMASRRLRRILRGHCWSASR